jgi:hypothetical protein
MHIIIYLISIKSNYKARLKEKNYINYLHITRYK